MEYRQYAPSASLAAAVQCLWTLEGHAAELGGELQPIVPDGRPELVMHFGDAFERIHGETIDRQATILFAGQLTGPLLLRPTARIAVLGVRFHPYGAVALLDQPQHEFVDMTVGIDQVSRALFRSLRDVRDSITSLDQARCAIEQQLACRLDLGRIDARIQHAVDAIGHYRGRMAVEDLARRVGMTRRHLERQFNALIGISPKRLGRITRFQHALGILNRACLAEARAVGDERRRACLAEARSVGDERRRERGADTAANCGYADQSHFIRECQELTGQPPSAYLLERAQLTGFFTESA